MSTSPVEYSPFPPTSDPLAGVDTPEEIQQRLNGADNPLAADTPTPDEWLEPEPLGNELPDVPAFDPGLLPDSLRPLVEDVAERMQVPLDFPAVAAIATLAGVTNRRALIQPKAKDTSWVVTPNVWGGMVAPPGMMKSPVMSCITQPARAIEALWRSEHEQSFAEYESEQERAKLDCAAWAENYKHARKKGKELPDKPVSNLQEPIQRRLLTSDATFEALHQSLAQNPAGLFL